MGNTLGNTQKATKTYIYIYMWGEDSGIMCSKLRLELALQLQLALALQRQFQLQLGARVASTVTPLGKATRRTAPTVSAAWPAVRINPWSGSTQHPEPISPSSRLSTVTQPASAALGNASFPLPLTSYGNL